MLSWRNGLIPNSSLSDRSTLRVLNWADAWAHHDPAGPHWHLGPVAIEPRVQRQGIGSALLTAFCVHMDAYGAVAYLETDQRLAMPFYLGAPLRTDFVERISPASAGERGALVQGSIITGLGSTFWGQA